MDEGLFAWGAVAVAAVVLLKLFRGYRSPALLRRAAEAVAEGAPLLDVRTPEEFDEGHHPAARNVPVSHLRQSLPELRSRGGPVVLYCRTGSRSRAAARALRAAGIPDVLDLGPMRNAERLPAVESPTKDRRSIPSSRKRRRARAS